MAVRRILLPWDSQPQGLAEVDFSSWQAQGLEVYWPLKDGDARDYGQRGVNGTFSAAVATTPTPYGMGLAFTGSQRVSATAPDAIANATQITQSVLVRFNAFTNAYNTVISRGGSTAGYSDIHVKSTGKLAIYCNCAGGDVFYDGTGTNTLVTGVWYHLCITYDSVNGLVSYINGAVDGSAAAKGNLNALTGTKNIAVADNPPNNTGRYVNGTVLDARFYSRSMNSAQVRAINPMGPDAWQVFAPRSIWVPVSAGGGAPTLALTGYAATGSAGILVPALSLAVTGNGATAAQGTATPSLSLATTGNTATSAAGTPVASISLALTGNGATASVGTVGIGGTTQALTGNEVTASAGTPVAAISLALTGNGVTSAAGTVTPQVSLALTGNAATTAVGTPVAGLSLAITGNAATASAGTVAVPGVIVPSSNLATTAAGTVSPGITLALTGNGATASVGSVSPAISLALSGLAGTSSAGIVIPGLSLALSGNAAAADTGTIAVATGDATVALTGNLATAYAGSLGIGGAVGLSAWWRYDVPVNDMRYAVPVHNLRYDVDTENLT